MSDEEIKIEGKLTNSYVSYKHTFDEDGVRTKHDEACVTTIQCKKRDFQDWTILKHKRASG